MADTPLEYRPVEVHEIEQLFDCPVEAVTKEVADYVRGTCELAGKCGLSAICQTTDLAFIETPVPTTTAEIAVDCPRPRCPDTSLVKKLARKLGHLPEYANEIVYESRLRESDRMEKPTIQYFENLMDVEGEAAKVDLRTRLEKAQAKADEVQREELAKARKKFNPKRL